MFGIQKALLCTLAVCQSSVEIAERWTAAARMPQVQVRTPDLSTSVQSDFHQVQ